MMRFVRVMLLVPLLLLGGNAYATDASQREAARLLETMGMANALNQTIERMLTVQLQQQPKLAPYHDVMMKFLTKYMSFEALKPDLVRIYSEAFTESELKDLIAFYQTETGKKTIRIMPQLAQMGGQFGANKVRMHAGELQEMIQAEAKRRQEQQAH